MHSFKRWKLTVCFFLERRFERPREWRSGTERLKGGGEKIVDSGLRVDGKVGAVARSNAERGAGQQSVEPR